MVSRPNWVEGFVDRNWPGLTAINGVQPPFGFCRPGFVDFVSLFVAQRGKQLVRDVHAVIEVKRFGGLENLLLGQ
jgi:hypothetical protein